ncbi:Golgi SNAP receptor complex member 1-1 isoform X2 [Cinnamomum micranthum f. kanehirae]|uniref:Golgi SNAP receptor complex member 1-1 isoform X2 n=1 Tax=Cinnamomum micranthum f. kanehirae TaxID=337451 RepID=A0A443NAD8_9MAGN|nr:Golgi SNAP receptor complex member 1-1 isoform X2 [Cinnamomum micranthum f. kanehirae]
MDSQISWDSLRKQSLMLFMQARKLVAQLDEQMSFYRRLVATKADGSESDLESGIEQLLKELQ